VVNFGATPFRYPAFGYSSVELIDKTSVQRAELLTEWLFNLVLLDVKSRKNGDRLSQMTAPAPYRRSSSSYDFDYISGSVNEVSAHLITHHIFERLNPFLGNAYIVESCLFKHFLF